MEKKDLMSLNSIQDCTPHNLDIHSSIPKFGKALFLHNGQFIQKNKTKKLTHETYFSFVQPHLIHSHHLTNIDYVLFSDASAFGIGSEHHSLYNNNKLDNLPNSIIAGIIKQKLCIGQAQESLLTDSFKDLVSYKKNIVCYDSNLAELFAINEGLLLATDMGIQHLHIYTDSAVSIKYIRKHIEQRTDYLNNVKFSSVTELIVQSLQSFDSCHFHHVPRKLNKQVDKITKQTRNLFK